MLATRSRLADVDLGQNGAGGVVQGPRHASGEELSAPLQNAVARVGGSVRSEVKAKGWWAAGSKDATGQASAPVELLVLGVFRMLGRACTFDDLEELTDISAETHRR